MIPYARQDIQKIDIDSAVRILQSDFITQGPVTPKFESAVAKKVHSKYSVAVNSATSALHIACLACGLKKGDILWTSPISFVASANCALYCQAKVDFVDIDARTYNMSPEALEIKFSKAKKQGKLPKVLIPVDFCGQPCEMESIRKLANEYGCKVIIDASHSLGGVYKGSPVGSNKYSDITVFSFHAIKIITTGEGGMAVTNNQILFNKMSLLRSHGIKKNINNKKWLYQQLDLGYNYRITDFQSAIGLSQLKRLDTYIDKRQTLAKRYGQLLSNLPIVSPFQHKDCISSWHLYVIQLKLETIKKSRQEVFDYMLNNNISVNVHYIPIHTQPYYQKLGFNYGDFKEAENYYNNVITIPLYPSLSDKEQDKVINTLSNILVGAK